MLHLKRVSIVQLGIAKSIGRVEKKILGTVHLVNFHMHLNNVYI